MSYDNLTAYFRLWAEYYSKIEIKEAVKKPAIIHFTSSNSGRPWENRKHPKSGLYRKYWFAMCGNMAWTYFAYCLNNTASTFTGNAAVFGKVYFPRLVTPISTVITGLLEFAVNAVLFACFWVFFKLSGAAIAVTWALALFPLLIVQMAALGLGCGVIISSLTTKYRDLSVLVSFGVSLWMYITPIIYSSGSLSPKLRAVCMLNPMAPIIEMLRFACLGTGDFSLLYWGISLAVTAVILALGVALFSRVEKTFMDTV